LFEYIHPSIERGSTFTAEDLRHFTRRLDLPPAESIQANYEAVHSAVLLNRRAPAAASGALFEQCIYDAMCRSGVDPSWIQTGVDLADGNNAEADFVISVPSRGRRAVFVKVSLRERWKQIDRDAMVIGYRHNDLRDNMSLIFLREHLGDSIGQATRKAAVTAQQCYARLSVHTALDHAAIGAWLGGLL